MIHVQGGKTFGLSIPADYYGKLEWEFEQLMKAGPVEEVELSYRAMNFIVTAWHMTDWIFPHLQSPAKEQFVACTDFQRWIKQQSRYIAACRDVATASKHLEVTRGADARIQTVGIPLSYERNPYKGHSTVWLIGIDGTLTAMDEFCREVIGFWQCFLEMHGLFP
jgi:hypothetical protein